MAKKKIDASKRAASSKGKSQKWAQKVGKRDKANHAAPQKSELGEIIEGLQREAARDPDIREPYSSFGAGDPVDYRERLQRHIDDQTRDPDIPRGPEI